MSLQLTAATVSAMLTYLAVEPEEGADHLKVLDKTLKSYGLKRTQFVTEDTCFALGYHRGLNGRGFTPEQAPVNGDGADKDSMKVLEDGYGFGLESRDLPLTPPPSVVYAAYKDGSLQQGGMVRWVQGVNLSGGRRLVRPLTVGSGKTAIVIPAGTPVDVLSEDVEKDGVPHLVVLFDGSPLLVPNPADAPAVVSADQRVVPEGKKRAAKARVAKEPKEPKAPREKKERGPTLRDCIIDVMEGADGGPGPFQGNGPFASRVRKLAQERGIGEAASTFIQKADKHVPYYLNCYVPTKDGETGRMGVEKPLAWVVAAVKGRRAYLNCDADVSHDDRILKLPDDIRNELKDREARLATTKPAPKAKEETAPAAPAE